MFDEIRDKKSATAPESVHFVTRNVRSLNVLPVFVTILVMVCLAGCRQAEPPIESTQLESSALPATQPVGSIETPSAEPRLQAVRAKQDPRLDGWETEVWNEIAGEKLNRIGGWLSSADELTVDDVTKLISEGGIKATSFLAEQPETWSDGQLTIESGPVSPERQPMSSQEFLQRFQSFAAHFDNSRNVHFKFKIVRIAQSETTLNTAVLFQADTHDANLAIQVNADWECEWNIVGNDLRLATLRVSKAELIRGRHDSGSLFADCTRSVFRNVESFDEQLMKGTNYWRRHLQAALGIDLFGHQGLSIGDANGDGLDDIYICQPGGVPNKLYLQGRDGTCLDRSVESQTDFLDRTRAALFVDFDNDGDQDLALVVDAHVIFLANDGAAKFSIEHSQFVGTSVTLAAADYDLDGDVDFVRMRLQCPTWRRRRANALP